MKSFRLILGLGYSLGASGFPLCPSGPKTKLNILFGSFDYEYVPPNEQAAAFDTTLRSGYPKGTPAGLRGEALRSALRSGQCIGWNLAKTPLEPGLLSVNGKGCLEFLNNKLTQSFQADGLSEKMGNFREACLLNAKGRVVDRLSVAMTGKESAFLLTSPGHSGQALFNRLDPFIFPLDQVTLKECSGSASIFTLASVKRHDLQLAFDTHIVPQLNLKNDNHHKLPSDHQCLRIPLEDGSSLLVIPSAFLPPCTAYAFTFCFLDDNGIGSRAWENLVSEDNTQGPVEIGPLEYETLRIEAGAPGFDHEMTGSHKDATETPATPLELHLEKTIDVDKGCYLGQEGVAAVLKNPRGPPRTLYQVVFEDDFNIYDHQSAGDNSKVENLTRVPARGDKLFVLGSNEEIAVGTLTSVAEPGGTGDPVTVGLALVRRSDSVLKQMKGMDLEIPRPIAKDDVVNDGSGTIAPPPLNPLDGLEVIVGGTFTVGTLKVVPSQRYQKGQNMFDDDVPDYMTDLEVNAKDDFADAAFHSSGSPGRTSDESSEATPVVDVDFEESSLEDAEALAKAEEEAAKAKAEGAAAEAKRKAEKMESLEDAEALAKAEEAAKAKAEGAAAEAKRKAEKMEMLRKRAEEAMARRKQKKGNQ